MRRLTACLVAGLLAGLLSALLAGCGTKGPLYNPRPVPDDDRPRPVR